MKESAAAKPYSGPDVEILGTPESIPADIALIHESVIEDWPVTRDIMQTSVDRLDEIQRKKTVDIPCGDGIFPSAAVADANAMKAGALLKSMVDANLRRRQASNPQKPQTTINVGVNVDNRIDEKRSATLAIAERIRAGRILQHTDNG